jgi:hypothetical protein
VLLVLSLIVLRYVDEARLPNGLIALCFAGALVLAVALVALGVGLLRAGKPDPVLAR